MNCLSCGRFMTITAPIPYCSNIYCREYKTLEDSWIEWYVMLCNGDINHLHNLKKAGKEYVKKVKEKLSDCGIELIK